MLRYPPSVLAAAAVLVAEAHDEAAALAAAASLQVQLPCAPAYQPRHCGGRFVCLACVSCSAATAVFMTVSLV